MKKLLLLAVALFATTLVGCSGKTDKANPTETKATETTEVKAEAPAAVEAEEGTPEAVAQKFLDALTSGETEGIWEICVSKRTKDEVLKEVKETSAQFKSANATFSLGEIKVDGDKAVAEMGMKMGENEGKLPLPLVKVDGTWKIDIDAE